MLDAGSSHTKLYLYKWDGEKLHETAEARQVHSCPVNGMCMIYVSKGVRENHGPILSTIVCPF